VILDNQQFSRYISAVYDEQIKRNFKWLANTTLKTCCQLWHNA
jgi:hypothetical protein